MTDNHQRGSGPVAVDDTSPEGITLMVSTSHGSVRMCPRHPHYAPEERCVVVVEPAAFVRLWRNDPSGAHRELAFGTPDSWRCDYKYESKEREFLPTQRYPQELAQVSCLASVWRLPEPRPWWRRFGAQAIEERHAAYIGFTDGITRTLWLMSNGATAFPVECDMRNGAELLQQHAGAPGYARRSVAELLSGRSLREP